MHEALKGIPTTLAGIYNNVASGKFLFEGQVKRTFEDIEEMYKYLDTPDKLTDTLYGNYIKWKYTFPFAKEPDDISIKEYRGYLGDQYSKWHKESVKHHAAIVTVNLIEAGELPRCAVLLGVIHDAGKKYTCATNKAGELCFYNHALVSAYIGLWWAWNFLAEEERKPFLAVIYGHDLPWQRWQKHPEEKERYQNELIEFLDQEAATRAIALIEKLSECDEGCEDENYIKDPLIYQKVIRGLKVIEQF